VGELLDKSRWDMDSLLAWSFIWDDLQARGRIGELGRK